ncbi:MAG: hypothetical protein EPN21_04030 [Methylococcaceae bacterium]|nr:MAG: hypothetical protein EPN21_04030 [Methylococcaceae bacterium]
MKTPILLFCLGFTQACLAEQMPEPDPPYAVQDQPRPSIPRKKLAVTGPQEWTFHKTADGTHPSNAEQNIVWLMNRARQNPAAEGAFLADSGDANIASAIDFFNVDVDQLQAEFSSYSSQPPAAFDVRLYRAALAHSRDLIARDSQDHNNQFERVDRAGFSYRYIGGNVFAYADSSLDCHAAWNIDWGFEADGMQTGRGHRVNLMSLREGNTLSNVGIAAVRDNDINTSVGPWVVTGNYAEANVASPNHFNRFIVGTVWRDKNHNARYDSGEGLGNVKVRPRGGAYWAKTAKSGGYAVPITAAGSYSVGFSGGPLETSQALPVTVGNDSVLLDLVL